MNKLTKWMNMSYREIMEYQRFKNMFPRIKVKELDIPLYPGDFVTVMKGPEQGKSGKVLAVFRSLNWIYVRALNLKTYNYRDSNNREKFIMIERPFLADEVMLLERDNKGIPTKVNIGVTPGGNVVRVSQNTGNVILYPREGDPYLVGAYCYKPAYTEGPYDTLPEDTIERTYTPTIHTLEEEVTMKYKDWMQKVMRQTGWKDLADRKPPPEPPIPKKTLMQFQLPYLDVVKIKPKKNEEIEKKKVSSARQ